MVPTMDMQLTVPLTAMEMDIMVTGQTTVVTLPMSAIQMVLITAQEDLDRFPHQQEEDQILLEREDQEQRIIQLREHSSEIMMVK